VMYSAIPKLVIALLKESISYPPLLDPLFSFQLKLRRKPLT